MSEVALVFQIVFFGFAMSLFSVIGAFTYAINQKRLDRFLSIFIAMASGTLLGGAFFHMVPHGLEVFKNKYNFFALLVAGFFVMYTLELFVQWHHCQKRAQQQAKPQGLMILVADGLHNFIGGLGIGAAFIANPTLGVQMWVVALFHEIPQEIGDFAILLDSGLDRKKALTLNFISSLTFPLAMLLVFPNPSQGQFSITSEAALVGEAHLQIWDAAGRLVRDKVFDSNGNGLNTTVDLAGESAGIYLLRLDTEQGSAFAKLQVQE